MGVCKDTSGGVQFVPSEVVWLDLGVEDALGDGRSCVPLTVECTVPSGADTGYTVLRGTGCVR